MAGRDEHQHFLWDVGTRELPLSLVSTDGFGMGMEEPFAHVTVSVGFIIQAEKVH